MDSNVATKTRQLNIIAREIKQNWTKPYFGAVPYLNAMLSLHDMTDNYFEDSAKTIVIYFLANAQTWRGEVARRVKSELNGMSKQVN